MTQNTTGYTDAEIQGATQSLLQTTITYQTDSLGAKEIQVTFDAVQQAAIGVFLLFPTSVFYLIMLGASRLNEQLQVQAQNVLQLLTLLQVSGRQVLPVSNVSALADAGVALQSLQGAAASRSASFGSIASTPAFQQFSSSVSNFLGANGTSVKSGGAIVPTPQDAKKQISILYSQILSTQATLIQLAGFLEEALADYLAADLPAVMSSSVLQSAAQGIATLVNQLSAQSQSEQLSGLRLTTLQLLATRAVVQQVGGFTQPSSIYPLAGTGLPYSDATHLANPASLSSNLYAPYEISTTPLLTITMDGQPTLSRNLNNSQFAEMFGTTLEPFVIDGTNDTLSIKETTSSTTYVFSIPHTTYSAAALVTYLNTVIGPQFTAFAQGTAGNQFIDIRYVGSSPTPTFQAGILFPAVSNSTAFYLGFPIGLGLNARPSTARQVVANLNQFTPTMVASVAVDPIAGGASLNMRSDITDPSRIVVYRTNGNGTVAVTGANSLTLTTPAGLIAAGVKSGDSLVFRAGVNTNTKWIVSTVTDTTVSATGTTTPVAGATTYEIGPTLHVQVGYVLEVPGTGVNHGIYGVTEIGPTALEVPFEFEVDTILHGVIAQGSVPYLFVGNVGQEKPVFSSINTTTASSVSVGGAGASLFFTSPPGTAVGSTPWVQLAETVSGIGLGDTLELYLSAYNVPSSVFQITSVQGDLLGISPAVGDSVTFPFVSDVPPPFALLRSGAYAAYTAFAKQLETWLDLPVNQSNYFPGLQPLLNAVINSAQPTPTQINASIASVQALLNSLVQATSSMPDQTLEFALLGYSVQRVEPVDNLIAMYTDNGSALAIDTLLQGQFSEFFGLTLATSSYGGAMLAQISTVAQQALPVRKTDRTSAVTSPVTGSSSSPDYEYDTSDSETSTPPDVPTNFESTSPSEQSNP